MKSEAKSKASEAAHLEFLRIQWADVHHTRLQDWELSKVVIAGAIGIASLKLFGEHPRLQVAASITVAALSFLALLITIRHRLHWNEKKEVIRNIEKELRIEYRDFSTNKKKTSIEKLFHTQTFLIAIYAVTTLFFIFLCFIEVKY